MKERSVFEWEEMKDGKWEIVRKGSGVVLMTEEELARFFCVRWHKVNGLQKKIQANGTLYLSETEAETLPIYEKGQYVGEAPLCTLQMIIALSFHLESIEAKRFRDYICSKVLESDVKWFPLLIRL